MKLPDNFLEAIIDKARMFPDDALSSVMILK